MNPGEITSKAKELLDIKKDADREEAIAKLDPKFKEAVLDEMASLKSGEDGAGDENDEKQGDDSGDQGEKKEGDESGEESDGADHDEKSEFDLEVEKLGEMSEEERKEALAEYQDDDNKQDLIDAVNVYIEDKESEKGEEEEPPKRESIFSRIGGFLSGNASKEEKKEVREEYDKLINEASNSQEGGDHKGAMESLEIALEIAPNKKEKKKTGGMIKALDKIMNPEKEKPKAGRPVQPISDEEIITDVLTLVVKCEQKEKQNIANGQNGIRFNRLKKQLKRTLRWLK